MRTSSLQQAQDEEVAVDVGRRVFGIDTLILNTASSKIGSLDGSKSAKTLPLALLLALRLDNLRKRQLYEHLRETVLIHQRSQLRIAAYCRLRGSGALATLLSNTLRNDRHCFHCASWPRFCKLYHQCNRADKRTKNVMKDRTFQSVPFANSERLQNIDHSKGEGEVHVNHTRLSVR